MEGGHSFEWLFFLSAGFVRKVDIYSRIVASSIEVV